jgi:RNA polymerase sigma-70 factor (ECF subfamily)
MLVEACLAGDRSAFAQLVDAYQSKLYNATYRITGSPADAMDATQDAFVKAYENLNTFDPSRRFFSWIYRIALNEALNIIDRRRGDSELPDEIPGDRDDPEQACEANETSEHIQKALMTLPKDQREVLVLRHFHGLSYEEIGDVVGISEKTVKSRLFTARRSLRAALLNQGTIQ